MTVTLAQVEQETARKVGPFYMLQMDRQIPSTATFERAFFPGLRSSIELDLVTNLYLLRRGLDWQGNAVAVPIDDRQRTVAVYDPNLGAVNVDRPWSVVPASGEVCEFHHLDPAQELRPVVRAGLRRCFMQDRYSLGSGFIFEADLTVVLPWLIDPNWVRDVQLAPVSLNNGTPQDVPFTTFAQEGHVILRLGTGFGPFLGEVHIMIIRPVSTWVNAAESITGPTDDNDELEVDIDYAAAAGHIEGWHNYPAKLQAAAAGGLQATQVMAAQEFTRQAHIWVPPRERKVAFESLMGFSSVVVNA